MSPTNPGNFVNDLVEMASAFKRLPEVEAERDGLAEAVNGYLSTIQRLELKLVDRANEIDSLHSRIRTLEVDRDHAETMFLEADDRTARALDFIKATFGNAGSLIQALEPVKATLPANADDGSMHELVREQPPLEPIPNVNVPDPTPEAQPTTQPQCQSEVPPSVPSASPMSDEASHGISSTDASASPAPEVASAHPTQGSDAPISQGGASPSVLNTATPEATAIGLTDDSFPMPPISPGRYSGKTYSAAKQEVGFTWPNRDEWLDNGGTLDNFYA